MSVQEKVNRALLAALEAARVEFYLEDLASENTLAQNMSERWEWASQRINESNAAVEAVEAIILAAIAANKTVANCDSPVLEPRNATADEKGNATGDVPDEGARVLVRTSNQEAWVVGAYIKLDEDHPMVRRGRRCFLNHGSVREMKLLSWALFDRWYAL